jgi:hypothetical protein
MTQSDLFDAAESSLPRKAHGMAPLFAEKMPPIDATDKARCHHCLRGQVPV